MRLMRAFTEHPASVGESYIEHLARAMCFGARMIGGGVACLVHAVLPFLFVRTGSRAVGELYQQMARRRRSRPRASATRFSL